MSLIFCFFERRIRIFLATTAPVPVVARKGRYTTPEPSPQFQGGLLPVQPVGPPGSHRLERPG